jgi:hypothetical protein
MPHALAPIDRVAGSTFVVPTEARESDATSAWRSD